MPQAELLTSKDVCQHLRITWPKLKVLINNGDIPAFRLGHRTYRFEPEAIENYKRRIVTTS